MALPIGEIQEAITHTPEFVRYAVAGGAGAILGGFAMRKFMRSPLNDEGFSVYTTPDINALQAVIDVCAENGLEPSKEITDENVIRALMSDGRTVFNTSRPEAWEAMGQPAGAPMLRVKNPREAADSAVRIFGDKGFEAEILEGPVEEAVEGEMHFVSTDALACGLIGFREHVVKMGDKPPAWDPGKQLGFAEPA